MESKKKFILLSERNKHEILCYLPENMTMLKMANFFHNFSDVTRLKILMCLCMCDLCVSDISALLDINQTTVSHQLQILRSENLVTYSRQGKIILYTLKNKSINELMLSAVNNF